MQTIFKVFNESISQLILYIILQGLGEVVQASKNSPLPVGQAVMYFNHGAFSEYKV